MKMSGDHYNLNQLNQANKLKIIWEVLMLDFIIVNFLIYPKFDGY